MSEIAVWKYTLQPRYPGQVDVRWCREGYAIEHSDGRMCDTYWQSGGDAHLLSESERATAIRLFVMADFDELDRYAWSSKSTWETYHVNDREHVTSQHGLQSRWFIRRGAAPDLPTQVENARQRLSDAEQALRSARFAVEVRREELRDLTRTASATSEQEPTKADR